MSSTSLQVGWGHGEAAAVLPVGTGRVDPLAATPAPALAPRRVLSSPERLVAWLVGVMVALLGVIGFVNSFAEVAAAVQPSFGALAWTAPIGIDLGIAVFTGLDLLLARLGMRLWWLRLVPWSLVAVTIVLNVAQPLGRGDVIGAGAHGVLPLLWVVAVEVAAHVMRQWAGLGQTGAERRAAGRMDRVRASRWLLAPVSTLRIRRLMILWEERSYQAALDRWQARRRARGHMAKKHGPIKWRWKAPIDQRLDYRYAQLSLTSPDGPDDVAGDSTSSGARTPGGGSPRRQGVVPKPRSSTRRPSGRVAGSGRLPAGSDAERADEAMPAAREVAAELAAAGAPLNRETLRDGLRARDAGVGNSVLGEVLARLRAEPTPAPVEVSP